MKDLAKLKFDVNEKPLDVKLKKYIIEKNQCQKY